MPAPRPPGSRPAATGSQLTTGQHQVNVAFTALNSSPGARAYYDAHRGRGATHHQALRALGNRLVGILHGCLRHRAHYNEATAWPLTNNADQVAA